LLPANIDFETRSTIDLKATGVYPYAAHPTTDVWVLAVAYGDEEPEIWCPQAPELFPGHNLVADRLACHIVDGGELHAWNASFERQIWNGIMAPRYKFPRPEMDQFFCSMVDAAAYGLPLALENASDVLKTEFQKDMEGNRLMKQMMKPKSHADGLLEWEDPYAYALGADAHKAKYGTRTIKKGVKYPFEETKIFRLAQYCILDVKTERAVSKLIQPLKPSERELYLLDQKINDRGVFLDAPLAKAAIKVAEIAMAKANADMAAATDGKVQAVTQVIELTKWVQEQGVPCTSVAKDALTQMLEIPTVAHEFVYILGSQPEPKDFEDFRCAKCGLPKRDLAHSGGAPQISAAVRRVLEIRQESGKSSVAKIEKMLDYASLDGFMRGMLAFLGAGTGRWAGRGPQPQNFPRGVVPGVEYLLAWILSCDIEALNLVASVMDILSSALRSFMRAKPGHQLHVADFAQIEARVLAWLAGQDDLVRIFRSGKDVYKVLAAKIYKVSEAEVTKIQRFVGKSATLGLGYQMGAGKFVAACKMLSGVDISEEFSKEVVTTYRQANSKIVELWKNLNAHALAAVEMRQPPESSIPVRYYREGEWLFCELPSGRTLKYARPRIVPREMPWTDDEGNPVVRDCIQVQGFNGMTRKWERQYLYGGLLAENITQAVARDLMAEAMVRVENAGFSVVLTVHDEVVSEAPDTIGSVEEFEKLMCEIPAWATGCPVAAEAWTGLRYKK